MKEHELKRQKELVELAGRVLIKNYRQPPIVMAAGRGAELWDVAGNRYLDMTSGIAVCSLGHSHPRLAARVARQAATLQHTSNLYFVEEQVLLAKDITDRCFADRVFFCNSGAEANEGAMKLARRYQRVVNGQDRDLIVSTINSFHGRSMATVSITGQEKYRTDFGRLLEPVKYVPFDDLDAAAQALEGREACAFIVEPIQAEGGIVVPSEKYLLGLRELTKATGTLLIYDEVQTGMGRTGKWFGHHHDDVAPDVMTMAKALGGGVPIGAVAASEQAAEGLAWKEGGAVPHATTFGGNPLACAAAREVFATIEEEDILANVVAVGDYLAERLGELAARYPGVCEGVRGRGLLRGLNTHAKAAAAGPIYAGARERGLLLSLAGGTVVRFAPPLIVTRAHVDEAIGILDDTLSAVAGSTGA